jgi:peptidoglycan hydrolase-like protein with peptidoglycan-binding domain
MNVMPSAAFSYTPEIATVQELLAKRGFNPGAIDGIKGTSTTEAIVAAQTFYKLAADGVVGTETISALEADTYQVDAHVDAPSASVPDSNSSNDNILEIQKLLAKRGFNPGAFDGAKGVSTTEAIVAAQTFYKLAADGVIGSATIAALEADTYEVDVPSEAVPASSKHKSVAKSQVTANLQNLLNARGFYHGAIDGINGPKTKEAVVKSQEAYGLIPDGVAGSITMAALEADIKVASTDDPKVATNQPTSDVYSDRVLEGQTLLSKLGLYDGALDGVQGSRTTAAIKQAQGLYGLPVDGVLGNQTLDTLKS